MRLVHRRAGALQLDVEALREERGQALRGLARAPRVLREQRLPHRPVLGARQRDQAAAELREPVPLQPGLVALHVGKPRARQQLAQVQVPGAVLHQQQQAAGRLLARGRLEPHVGTDHRLHACLARGRIELDRAEEIAQVGDGERTLPVGSGGFHRFVDPQGAVDDGEFGVGAQVDESHPAILKSAAS